MSEDTVKTKEQKADEAIKRLAMRSSLGTSGQLPLVNGEGIDCSMDGTYWVEFAEASGEQIADLAAVVGTEVIDYKAGRETGTLRWDPFDFLEVMVQHNLIRSAVLPKEERADDGTVTLKADSWPSEKSERQKRLQKMPIGLIGALFSMGIDYFLSEEDEEVVDDAKNLPKQLDTIEEEASPDLP